MILTIHQPEYLPWMGLLNKLMYADVYVALDNVQYRHKYYQNRNRVPTKNGECWLNVPVYRKGEKTNFIKDIKINNNTNWKKKTWKTISLSYKNSPYFKNYCDYFEELYLTEWESLSELNLNIITNLCSFLNIEIKIIRASDMNIDGIGPKLILDICKAIRPEIYISGQSGIAGRGEDVNGIFLKENIKVIYQKFEHPSYDTLLDSFVPYMSVIDLLFNYGPYSNEILSMDGGWYYKNR